MKNLLISTSTILLLSNLYGCAGSSATDDEEGTTSAASSSGSLVINEIVAKASDDGHDWFELYVTEGSVNLSDYAIVDDNEDREAQTLPDVTLSAGEYYVIEAIDEDDTPTEGLSFVTFKLGSSDSLTLTSGESTVSSLSWEDGQAAEGYSYGLLPDGSGEAQTLSPTKGYENAALTSEVPTLPSDTVVATYAELVINEIVAKDGSGGHDWFELYVSGSESISLADYSVADEDSFETVSLPNITLSPGEYFTIYATDEELESDLSVAIKLGANDSISLYKDDDLIDYVEWDKGDALYSFSYGRYPDGNGNMQTLSPTPNASNSLAERGPLLINEIVSRNVNEGEDWFELFNNGSESISLSTYSVIDESDNIEAVALPAIDLEPGAHVVIYASDEDPGSYYVPFKLGAEDSLSLIFNGETVDYLEWDDSDAPEGYSYGAFPDGAWTSRTLETTPGTANQEAIVFDTDVIESIYVDIEEADWNDMLTNALEEEYHVANVTYKGVTLENIAIRTKGNSSLSAVANSDSERFSFKIDTNEYVDGQKLLNLKKLNLNNNYKDPTYMRETIAYNLMRELDVPAPRTAYANLYINNELHGLYTLVEQVDGEFLERHFSNPEGDLYKPDGTGVTNAVGHDLIWVDELYETYTAVELKTNEETTDNQAFMTFLNELNNGSEQDELESVLDVDAVLRYLAVSTAIGNLDSYQGGLAHNYYIYENSEQFSVVPWDFNESFGTFSMGCTADEIENLYINEPTSGALSERPLIARLLENEDYVDTYHSYIEALISGGLDPDNLALTISDTADLIRDAVYADPTAFYSSSEFETALTSSVSTIPGLLDFATARVSSLNDQLNGVTPSSGDGTGSCSGDMGGPPMGGMPPGRP